MRRKNSTYAILGMLSIQPMSGYDIRKEIGESIAYFWREGYGKIYPELRLLASEGMIKQRLKAGSGRADRKVFSLTAKGRAQLCNWLTRAPRPQTPRNELLLKLFFGRLAPGETCERHVLQFRKEQQQLLNTYEELERRLRATRSGELDLAFWLITASYGRHLSRALVDWSDETLRLLKREEKARAAKKTRAQ